MQNEEKPIEESVLEELKQIEEDATEEANNETNIPENIYTVQRDDNGNITNTDIIDIEDGVEEIKW